MHLQCFSQAMAQACSNGIVPAPLHCTVPMVPAEHLLGECMAKAKSFRCNTVRMQGECVAGRGERKANAWRLPRHPCALLSSVTSGHGAGLCTLMYVTVR